MKEYQTKEFDKLRHVMFTKRPKPQGELAIVPVLLREFSSYEETLYLLRSPANARRLADAVAELDGGKGKTTV